MSIPRFATTPVRKITRSLVTTKCVVSHVTYRAINQPVDDTISTSEATVRAVRGEPLSIDSVKTPAAIDTTIVATGRA
jgi:hypothetical protein